MFNRTVILLLSLIIKLQADPVLPGVMAATDGDPSMMVGGCVNAITGDLVLGVQDLTVRGAVELPITRSYVSGDGNGHSQGWEFFFPHFQMRFYSYSAVAKRAILSSPSGGKLHYYVTKFHKQWATMEPVQDKHAIGMTNNSSGLLSGRTNSKNNRIYFKLEKKKRKEIHLITGEGLRYLYSSKISAISEDDQDIYVLNEEQLPSGGWILYSHDKYGRPTEARVVNPQKNKTFSWAKFHYIGNYSQSRDMWVETSDGRKIRYSFDKKRNNNHESRFYLYEVTGDIPGNERCCFEAPKHFNPLLTHLSQGGDLLQKIVYQYRDRVQCVHYDDERCGRVKELWSPSGPQGQQICTHQFFYTKIHWQKDMSRCRQGGSTSVNGPHGFRAEYRWTKELRPEATLLFDTDRSSQPSIIHEYAWEVENTPGVGDLLAKRLREGNGQLLWERRYAYDGRFNPVTETFQGNLTGRSEGSYTRRHIYSNDDRNLLVEWTARRNPTPLWGGFRRAIY